MVSLPSVCIYDPVFDCIAVTLSRYQSPMAYISTFFKALEVLDNHRKHRFWRILLSTLF